MTLVYKDMTFCVNKQCTKKCRRYLTCEIKAKAKAFGLPIAVASFICVDKGEDGNVAHGADLEEFSGLRLHALGAVDDHDGGVGGHQGAVGVF
mgnify:CR=1 FL=1